MFRSIFKVSKPIHKYLGLVFLVYFLAMGITGALINHPAALHGWTLPRWLTPESYVPRDWNRGVLKEGVFSKTDPDRLFIGGKAGVWESRDAGRTFSPLAEGFPESVHDRDTRCLLLEEPAQGTLLLAGTRAGLYAHDFASGVWKRIPLPSSDADIVDLVRTGEEILVFTPLSCFALDAGSGKVREARLGGGAALPGKIPLFRFLLKIHDGSVLGLPGKLFMDAVGVGLAFLSLSAGYIWYFPRRRKRKKIPGAQVFRVLYAWHLKAGIWAGAFILLVALTGILIRPPFLPMIAGYTVPGVLGDDSGGGWGHEISRAVYLPGEKALLLSTRDGFFKGPADFSGPFAPADINLPVSGMGVGVLEPLSGNRLLVGSFSGLYLWDPAARKGTDPEGNPIPRGRGRGGMVSGALVRDGELLAWADYGRGLRLLQGDGIPMPEALKELPQLSLWLFLFEIHNGRIFRAWLGEWTWLIVPAGGILMVLVTLSGGYDWFYRRRKKQPERKEEKRTLDRLIPGTKGCVCHVSAETGVGRRLTDMGIYPGMQVTVVRNAPLKDPMEIEVDGCFISLRRSEARSVEMV